MWAFRFRVRINPVISSKANTCGQYAIDRLSKTNKKSKFGKGWCMKYLTTLLLMGCLGFWGASLMTPKAKADELDQKTVLNFEKPVQLPGIVLPAGTYVFKIAKLTTDRDVVQVLNLDETKIYTTIMTVPRFRQDATGNTTIVFEERSAGEPRAIKEWFFPDRRYGHEFIYPKNEPSALARVEPAVPDSTVAMEHPEQAENHETVTPSDDSDYMRQLQQKQTEPEAARTDQSADMNKPGEDAESNYLQLLQQKNQQQAQIPAQSATIRELPRTAGHMPLVLFSGILLAAISFGLRRLTA
jgi:hypothetical protein